LNIAFPNANTICAPDEAEIGKARPTLVTQLKHQTAPKHNLPGLVLRQRGSHPKAVVRVKPVKGLAQCDKRRRINEVLLVPINRDEKYPAVDCLNHNGVPLLILLRGLRGALRDRNRVEIESDLLLRVSRMPRTFSTASVIFDRRARSRLRQLIPS
jgi:hypothetical protein